MAASEAIAEPGPHVIETVVPSVYSGLRLRAMPHALNVLTKLPRPLAKAAKSRKKNAAAKAAKKPAVG